MNVHQNGAGTAGRVVAAEIDRLVLAGLALDAGRAERIRRMVVDELRRLLAAHPLAAGSPSAGSGRSAGPVMVREPAQPGADGADSADFDRRVAGVVAARVADALRRAAERGGDHG